MRIEIEVSVNNEGTSAPWWIIIDPRQNFKCNDDGLHAIASMITGPFFSREEAQRELTNRHYDYSKNAKVYCHSGYHTEQYSSKVKF